MKYGTNGRLNGRLKLLIIASFAALLATFIATSLLSGLALSPEVSELQRISENHARAVALIAQFRGEVSEASVRLVTSVITGSSGSAGSFRDVSGLVRVLTPVVDTPYERERLVEMTRALTEGREAAERLHRAMASSDASQVRSSLLAVEDAVARFDSAAEQMVRFNASQVRDSSAWVARMQRHVLLMNVGVSALGALAGLLLLGIGLVTLSRLSRHLRDKEAFATRVAHDLRTPLQTIKFGTALLAQAKPGQGTVAHERLRAAIDRMAQTLEGLLNPSSPSEGGRERHAVVAEVLREVRADLESHIASAGAELDCRIEPEACAAMSPAHLRAVLQNVLGNALKYARKDGPRAVMVSTRRQGPFVRIEVTDWGLGISRSALDRVFEPGFRANAAQDGHGVGLSTVKRLVEISGGCVSIDSEEGRGTTVRIDLPAISPRVPLGHQELRPSPVADQHAL